MCPEVACGDEAVLIGRQNGQEITAVEFSRWADTIPWETLCSITKRVPRFYKTALGVIGARSSTGRPLRHCHCLVEFSDAGQEMHWTNALAKLQHFNGIDRN